MLLNNAQRLANLPNTTLTPDDIEQIAQRVAELLKPQLNAIAEKLELIDQQVEAPKTRTKKAAENAVDS